MNSRLSRTSCPAWMGALLLALVAGCSSSDRSSDPVTAPAGYSVFCKDRGLEIYLSSYSGNGGELVILVQADPASAEICEALSAAMVPTETSKPRPVPPPFPGTLLITRRGT